MTGPRVPRPPEPVQSWVDRYGAVRVDAPFDELLEGGVRALEIALGLPAEDREAAWALLAADALLTWAVEDAADAPEPEQALGAVTRALLAVEAAARGNEGAGSRTS